jgi:hypothetical protein
VLNQKEAQKVNISLGYFICPKNIIEPPKVAQVAKKFAQSDHPDQQSTYLTL